MNPILPKSNRYRNHDQLTADCINNLELIADICRYFADGTIIELLLEVLKKGYNNINYYATDTLLSLGQNVPIEIIIALAHNLEYANLTYAHRNRSRQTASDLDDGGGHLLFPCTGSEGQSVGFDHVSADSSSPSSRFSPTNAAESACHSLGQRQWLENTLRFQKHDGS